MRSIPTQDLLATNNSTPRSNELWRVLFDLIFFEMALNIFELTTNYQQASYQPGELKANQIPLSFYSIPDNRHV